MNPLILPEMAWAINSPIFGQPLEVLKQSANNFFTGEINQ